MENAAWTLCPSTSAFMFWVKKEKLIDMGDMINYVNNNKVNYDIIFSVSFGNNCCKSKVPVSAVTYRMSQSLV